MRGRIAIFATIIALLLALSAWVVVRTIDGGKPGEQEIQSAAPGTSTINDSREIIPESESLDTSLSPANGSAVTATDLVAKIAQQPPSDSGTVAEEEVSYRIQGEVHSDDGVPIAGADVAVFPFRQLTSSGEVRDLFREMTPGDAEAQSAAVASTRSDANGWFDVELDGPGTFLVEASASGYATAVEGPARLTRRDPDTLVDIALGVGFAVAGTLHDEAGAALSGVSVFLYEKIYGEQHSFHQRRVVTDGGGAFRFEGLDQREYFLMAKAEGCGGSLQRALVPPREEIELVARRARERALLVLDAENVRPIAGAEIVVLNREAYDHAVTDVAGLCTLLLAGDDADIAIQHEDYLLLEQRISLRATEDDAPLVILLRRGQESSGIVRTSDGKAAAGVQVALFQDASFLADMRATTTDSEGRFTIPSAAPDGAGVLVAKVPGWVQSLRHTGAAGSLPEAEIVLERAATLHGSVRDAAGVAIAGAWMRLRLGDGMDKVMAAAVRWLRGDRETWTDEQGVFVFDDVVPIEGYILEVEDAEHGLFYHELAAFPAAPVEITLARGASVIGRVNAEAGTVPRSVLIYAEWPGSPPLRRNRYTSEINGGRRCFAAADGTFQIDGIPEGPVTLYAHAVGLVAPPVVAEVAADARNEVELFLARPRSVQVRFTVPAAEWGNEWATFFLEQAGSTERWMGTTILSESGAVIFDGLRLGTYHAVVSTSDAAFSDPMENGSYRKTFTLDVNSPPQTEIIVGPVDRQ